MIEGLVSVVTPAYNSGKYIAETIESVMAQTYGGWELIVVDDASADDTGDIVRRYQEMEPRLRYYRLEENSGAAVARTKAMELARGEYIAFCDSDDIWLPEKLEKQVAYMQQTGHAFVCSAYEKMDEAGNDLGKVVRPRKRYDYDRLLLGGSAGNSTVIYSVRAMGKFQVPDIRKRNDEALWLRMLRMEPYIWGMNEVLARYRVRPDSLSARKTSLVKYHWRLYRNIEGLGVLRSLLCIGTRCAVKVLRLR